MKQDILTEKVNTEFIAYSNGDTITQESVEQTLHGDMDRFVFSFLDAITGGKKDVGFRLLNNILTGGGEVFSIIGLLVNQFELMYLEPEVSLPYCLLHSR